MKKIILVLATITISAGAFALNNITISSFSPQDTIKNQSTLNHLDDKKHPDGVMMHNGKVMQVKDGKKTVLKKEVTMQNGTKIDENGMVTKKGSSAVKMKEGQHIDMSGNMTFKKTDDKNRLNKPDSTKNHRKN